jgi:hypothetical protein
MKQERNHRIPSCLVSADDPVDFNNPPVGYEGDGGDEDMPPLIRMENPPSYVRSVMNIDGNTNSSGTDEMQEAPMAVPVNEYRIAVPSTVVSGGALPVVYYHDVTFIDDQTSTGRIVLDTRTALTSTVSSHSKI